MRGVAPSGQSAEKAKDTLEGGGRGVHEPACPAQPSGSNPGLSHRVIVSDVIRLLHF